MIKHINKTTNFSKTIFVYTIAIFIAFFALHTPTVFADSTNLIVNPTLSADPADGEFPLLWRPSTVGTNTAAWTYPVQGPNASTSAVQMKVTSYTDGFADWFTDPSPVTAFTQYHYTESYLSDTTGTVEAQYIVKDSVTGVVTNMYADLVTTQNTNGSWSTVDTTFATPAGATGVRIYHVINHVGTLAVANPFLAKTDTSVTFGHGMVTLSFDDGNQSQYDTAFPMLQNAGIYGTFAIISQAMLDTAENGTSTGDISNDYMNPAEIMRINRAGNEIADHTVNHCDLVTHLCPDGEIFNSPDPLSLIDEIGIAKTTIRSIGALPVDTFVYPYGSYNQATQDAVSGANFLAARSVDTGFNLPTSNRYALKVYSVTASTTTVADFQTKIKPLIDTAIENHVWLIFLFHQIEPASVIAQTHDMYATTPEVLQAIVSYLKDTHVSVVTMHNGVCQMNGMSADPRCSAKTVPDPAMDVSTSTPRSAVVGQPYHATVFATPAHPTDVLYWNVLNTPSWMRIATTSTTLTLSGTPDATSTSKISIAITETDPLIVGFDASYTLKVYETDGEACDEDSQYSGGSHSGGHGGSGHGNCDNNHGGGHGGGDGHGGHDGHGGGNSDACDLIDGSTGWYGSYFNYSSTDLGMELPGADWNHSYGDPLSATSTWMAPWYDDQFSKFDKIDGALTFGNNFFPFDSHPEQVTSGHDYHFGVHWSADVVATTTGNYAYTLNANDDVWIYVDDELVLNHPGVNNSTTTITGTIPLKAGDQIVDIYYAQRHVGLSDFSFSFSDHALNITPYSSKCDCSQGDGGDDEENTRPVIKLLGDNPAEVVLGSTYTDAGATAHDREDGDITSDIVTSSTVNTNILGRYKVTYNVEDSEGLDAVPVQRIVNVVAACSAPHITSALTVTGVQGLSFNYNLTYTPSSAAVSVITDNLPIGLSFISSTTPNKITGISTQVGTFSVPISVSNGCGNELKNLVITIGANTNHPPVITLVGANPTIISLGQSFIDPGAIATDQEDGIITSRIVVTGSVNTATLGTTTLVYSVTDSGGLSASTTRQVVVTPNSGTPKGKITFCLLLTDENNILATTTPAAFGIFGINLGTTTDIVHSNVSSKSWTTAAFAPNKKTILNTNDSDCYTVSNLNYGTYYYTPLDVTGSFWQSGKFNDQFNSTVNNVFDFFAYSPELFNATTTDDAARNFNSDGQVIVDSSHNDNFVYILSKDNTPPPQCILPTITSSLSLSATVGTAFSYQSVATSTTPLAISYSIGTSTLPAGLTFATTTGIISGTPTTAGTYPIKLTATNGCGQDIKTVTITVSNGGGGGGGGGPMCELPGITSSLTASATRGAAFSYIFTANTTPATTTPLTLSIATSTLPAGLSITATSTNSITIGGTPTVTGTFNIALKASNICGLDAKTLVITVSEPGVCTSNCGGGGGNIPVNPPGGGGGGGGNGPIVPNHLTITNEKVVETVPGIAFVTWDTNMLATRRVVYGNTSSNSTTPPNYGYTNSTELVPTPLLTSHGMVIAVTPGQTYYFRPTSTATTTNNPAFEIAVGKELVLNPGTGGSNPPNGCYYLYDYLRKDFNNNPIEVKKLQVFLNSFEGASLTVNGIYDDATIVEVNKFQVKYNGDVLIPWGDDGFSGSSYTYILTKKKVNEIYCQKAFPVNAQQQSEIDAFRAFQQSLRNAGVDLGTIGNPPTNTATSTGTTTPLENNVIGLATTTTPNLASRILTNTGNFAAAFFAWPFHFFSGKFNWCDWVILLLLIIIAIISYLWYREHRNNKKIEDVNKEIDLQK